MLWLLVAVPALAGLLAFRHTVELAAPHIVRGNGRRACGTDGGKPGATACAGSGRLDCTGCDRLRLFLAITSFIFLVTAFYAVGYLAREGSHALPNNPTMNCLL